VAVPSLATEEALANSNFSAAASPHPVLGGPTSPNLNLPEEGEEPSAFCGAGLTHPPCAMAAGEGSSRLAPFLQVRVHQLPVNDPVHVILQEGRVGGDEWQLLPGPVGGQGGPLSGGHEMRMKDEISKQLQLGLLDPQS
jgi:hypothetical protein